MVYAFSWRLLLAALTGWLDRRQQEAVAYVIEENRILGTWLVGMGPRFNVSGLQPLEVGAFGFMPKGMAHFCRSKTDMIMQVHGIGPFDIAMVDPLYQLTEKGVTVMSQGTILAPRDEHLVENWPQGCFAFKLGDRARGPLGERHGSGCPVFTGEWSNAILDSKSVRRPVLGNARRGEEAVTGPFPTAA